LPSQSRNVPVIVKKIYFLGGEEFRGLRKLKQFPILILLRKRGRGQKVKLLLAGKIYYKGEASGTPDPTNT
jgi:hypothetical protein